MKAQMVAKKQDETEERYFDRAYSLETTEETKAYYAKWAAVHDQEVARREGLQAAITVRQGERVCA
jgi:hypothetical protein